MNQRLISAVLSCGDQYCGEILLTNHMENGAYTPDQLRQDWRKALRFFFERAFYQGRRDVISAKVLEAACQVLDPDLFSPTTIDLNDDAFMDHLLVRLQQYIGKGKIGKARDIEMVGSALRFLRELPDWNIVAWSLARIGAGEVREHFVDLQKIVQIGPKIASFYTRDVVAAFGLEGNIPFDQQKYLQPVDVWVRRFAEKVMLVPAGASDNRIQEAVVELCANRECSAVKFNQGIWYLGYNAFDILLETLSAE